MPRLLIFETHPIQYRAPVYQALQSICPDTFEVIYASDFSVRGYRDEGFSETLSWDVPLLEGYPYRVLGNEVGQGIQSARSLSGKGIGQLFREAHPSVILLHSLAYEFNWVAYVHALRRRIPVWLRTETQDEAFPRSRVKNLLRSAAYRLAYLGIDRAFYIGELNKAHYLNHGLSSTKLTPARYCTPDAMKNQSDSQLASLRATLRQELNVSHDMTLVAFFGKLIEKKDPGLILDAVATIAPGQNAFSCLFVGSGILEETLRRKAESLQSQHGIQTNFTGFVNQKELPRYYLAADIVVLPSRQMGETWGLVANEAMQAGCAVIVSEAVGCHVDFEGWDRFRTIPVGDVAALANQIKELSALSRSFHWAEKQLVAYSVETAANTLHQAISSIGQT